MSDTCGNCLLPLGDRAEGVRHYGVRRAHQEVECVRLLHAEIERRDARIAELEAALAEERARLDWLESTLFFEGGRWLLAHDADVPGRWWPFVLVGLNHEKVGSHGTARECIDYMMLRDSTDAARKGEGEG